MTRHSSQLILRPTAGLRRRQPDRPKGVQQRPRWKPPFAVTITPQVLEEAGIHRLLTWRSRQIRLVGGSSGVTGVVLLGDKLADRLYEPQSL